MGRPSIYSKNYYRVMRRRRRITRITILLTALAVIFIVYNKSSIHDLRKLVEGFKLPVKNQVEQTPEKEPSAPDSSIPENSSKDVQPDGGEGKQGEYTVKVGENGTVTLLFEQKNGDIKYTGIIGDMSYSISEDGKSIAFDYPPTSDIWICNIKGEPRKLNSDVYIQSGSGSKYSKSSIMQRYGNNYVWAAKPVFLKDGRIVYQSNLPWFKKVNSYYLWVVDSDGKNNRCISTKGKAEPVKYSGFTDGGELIIEYGGSKYAVNVDKRYEREIN